MKVFVQEPEQTKKNDKIKVYTNPVEKAVTEPKAKTRKPNKLMVHGYDPVTNEIIKSLQAEAERKKKAIRDDASLCKVKVKKIRKKRDATEDKQYVIKGKDKSVVLEFSRRFGNSEKEKSTKRKQLGNSIGRSELRRQALKQKMEQMEMGVPPEPGIEQARGAVEGANVEDIDVDPQEDGDPEDGDNEVGWFRLDKLTERDYFDFLKSVQCSVYSTPNCNEFDTSGWKGTKCNSYECHNDLMKKDHMNCDEVKCGPITTEGGLDGDNINEEDGEVEERDFTDDLDELKEFRAQQERMERLERHQMEMVRAQEREMRMRHDEESAIQREAAEMRKMQREGEEIRRLKAQKEKERRQKEEEEKETKRFEQEETELQIIERQRQEILRLQKEREELLERGQLGEDDEGSHVSEEVRKKKKRDKSRRRKKRRSRRSKYIYESEQSKDFSEDSTYSDEDDEDEWFPGSSALFSFLSCGENLEFLDLCDTPGPEETVPVPIKNHANQHQKSPPTALYAAIGTQNWSIALRRLMDKPEEAAKMVTNASSDGRNIYHFFPLHIACLSGAPLLLVTMLVQTFPEAVHITAMGKLPIHMACEAQADHRIVFLLINAWPESLNEIDDDSKTPIEIASEGEGSEERRKIIQMLTKKMENTVTRTPTELYSNIDGQNWNSAMLRLVDMPQEATTWVSYSKENMEYRFLPLHAACLVGAPLLLISDLVIAYPDAVRKKTTQGKLPLHIACEVHADERVVKLLLEAWPESLYLKDSSGNSPQDIVAAADFSPERSAILEILEEKLYNSDTIVFSPTKLYELIDASQWEEAVRRILEAPEEVSTWVGTCQKIADARLLPLHVACSSLAPLLLIAVLIQTYPDSVKKTNNSGKLPIHLACEKRSDHRVIALLLHTWPESSAFKDEKGNTPVQTALLSRVSDERTKIVETLMDHEAELEQDEGALAIEMEAKALLATNGCEDEDTGIEDDMEASNSRSKQQPKSKKSKWRWGKKEKHALWAPDEEMFHKF